MKKESEFDLYHVDCGNLQISRVNIIGTVVNKFIADDRRYGFITIDDGSACIRAKTFAADNNLISNVQKGSLVMVIGRVREYNNEIYLQPEIVKALDNPNWELARKLELLKQYGKFSPLQPKTAVNGSHAEAKENIVEESVSSSNVTETLRQKLLSSIEAAGDSGAEMQKLVHEIGMPENEVNIAIQELLKEGEIYMARAGILKVV